MSAEPTKRPDGPDEELAAQSQDPNGIGRGGRWSTVAAVVAVLLVAGGVAAFQFLSSDPDTDPDSANGVVAPTEGIACPHLEQAAEAYERGDTAAFDREVARAAELAEEALQESGQVFGEAERIALELDLGQEKKVQSLLGRVGSACSDGA
jgi:hypothetical protein